MFHVFWLCTGDWIPMKHLPIWRQGVLAESGGNGKISISARAAPMICPYLSQMSFSLGFCDVFCVLNQRSRKRIHSMFSLTLQPRLAMSLMS